MDSIATSNYPPSFKKNDFEGVLKTPAQVMEFVKKSITEWYFGNGGQEKGIKPGMPAAPVNKNPVHSLSV